MRRFVEGTDRAQSTLFPECLEDWIRKVCVRFVALCRELGLLTTASVAIDGSKFKAVNTRDKNFTRAKMERRLAQIEESVARYLSQLDTADLQEPSEALAAKTA